MSAPRTVAVCGSCTSRDNFSSRFNPDYARWFDVTADVFQTSIISLMSPPLEDADIPELLEGPGTGSDGADVDYQVRITREDVTRAFLAKLAEAQPDYLVLDFFADVHFGAVQLPDGRHVTNNRWMLWPTAYYARLKDQGELTPLKIFKDPDAYLATWSEALDRFATFVAEHCPETRVVVHRGLYVDEAVVKGRPRPVPVRELRKLRPVNVARANKLWARLDDYALGTYGASHGWTAIDLREEGYMSSAEHPWKPFWVHYTPTYYHRFLAEMLTLDLERDLDPEDWAQVRGIADSAHERAVNQAVRWTPIRRALEERVRELEGLGPATAVKFAIGQRIRETRRRREQRRRVKQRPTKET
ncbi:hypothetical protein ABIE44_001383 [Marmoricola sp. OAE513]|uniref:DUF6270 domain-containing protein n=1 Tax=Marmoricola sp. OAE513 TaxID=2817894 RepID=UPI001AE8D272